VAAARRRPDATDPAPRLTSARPACDHAGVLDHLVRVAKAIAAADRNCPGRGDSIWPSLSLDEQTRYVGIAREAIETYIEAVADPEP
jgi:hypothetical protein